MHPLTVCGALLLLVIPTCQIPMVGGPCEYADTPGVATIVSVEPAPSSALNCTNNPVEVVFDFTPDDTAQAGRAATSRTLTIGEGLNPPRSWVQAEGLTVGSQHTCIRRDITKGACTPVIYRFPDIDTQAGLTACYATPEPAGFTLTVVPQEMNDAISGQVCMLLVTVANEEGEDSDEPVRISATANDAAVTVEPEAILPGEVCEITVIPAVTFPDDWEPQPQEADDSPYGDGVEVRVSIVGERDGGEQTADVSINVLPGEDLVEEYATEMRDLFIPWLAEEHPEFGITADTEWTPTIVKPHILVVTHYLFFSEEWEMSVMWHVMIPPYNWAHIYLRPRYTSTVPQYAYEIPSVTADPLPDPVPMEVPTEIDR